MKKQNAPNEIDQHDPVWIDKKLPDQYKIEEFLADGRKGKSVCDNQIEVEHSERRNEKVSPIYLAEQNCPDAFAPHQTGTDYDRCHQKVFLLLRASISISPKATRIIWLLFRSRYSTFLTDLAIE